MTLFVVVRLRGLYHWPSPFVPVPLLPSYYPDALELAWYYLWSNVYWLLFFGLTMIVRRTVRQRDRIEPRCGGGACDDCLTSFFCQPCVQCQLMRHEGLTYGRYELFTEVGTREVV